MCDTLNPLSIDGSGDDVGNENQRIQALQSECKNLDTRVSSVEDGIGKIQHSAGRIEAHLDGLKPQKTPVHQWIIAIGTLGACLASGFSIWNTIHESSKTRTSVQGQVTRIQSDLRMLTVAVAPQLLGQIGPVVTSILSVPATAVPSRLQQPIDALRLLRTQQAKNPASEITAASSAVKQLTTARPDVPQVWQAAAELVSYRSESPYYGQLKYADPESLRPCVGGVGGIFHNFSYQANYNCAFVLDGRVIHDSRLVRVFVIYHGGDLEMKNVEFQDCIFIFDFRAVPQPSGRVYMDNLLAVNNIQSANISASSGM
jgi:hypothetical protein